MSGKVIFCSECGFDNPVTAEDCGDCGNSLRHTGDESPSRATVPEAPEERSSLQAMPAPTEYPGAGANTTLRLIGGVVIMAGLVAGLWIVLEFGATQQTTLFGEPTGGSSTNSWGIASGLAVMLQGIAVGTLLIALAGLGDNLIGIRQRLERE